MIILYYNSFNGNNEQQAFKSGSLINNETVYETYAKYLFKVIDLYNNVGIKFFGLSIQNEPLNGENSYPVMYMSPDNQIQLINILGPMIKNSKYSYVKLIIYEHNWDNTAYPIQVLTDTSVSNYIDGASFHCYAGDVSAQTTVHNAAPNKNIYFTECSGSGTDNFSGNIQWNVNNIWIGSTVNWATWVTHWNLVLDQFNSPHNNGCNNCRGIFELNTNTYEYTMYEEWYGIQHFGKFISINGATRIDVNINNSQNCINGWSVSNSDNTTVIVVTNFCSNAESIGIQKNNAYIDVTIPPGLNTFYWS